MSKKFEYELMLRLEKAEKAIASLASKIEKDLGKAVETAFRGASEFDVVKFSKNIGSRIEQDVSSALKQAFSGSSEFDFSKRVASSVEQDVKAALQSAFSGSSEFTLATGGDVEQVKQAALALDANQRRAADYTLQLEQQRLAAVRERVNLEVNAFVTSRKEARATADAEQARMREAKQQALEGAFSDGIPLDVRERAEEEASRKRIQQIKDSSETKNILAEQDHQRELQRIEGEDAARKKADADALKRIQDQQAAEVARDADVYQRRQAEANIAASEKKAHDDKQKMYEKLWGAEKNAHTDRIAQIRESTKADQAAQEIRYKDHTTVLSTIKEAHALNASDLAAIEQRITTMTEAEAKQQLIAYQKTAKARVDYAIEQGYKLEAAEARRSANGARSVSAIFQVQQAIEDSMYAGLRGAGNNIAVLLTSITSGWVAIGGLIGVATIQLLSHLGVFEKLNEAMDGALWKTKEQVKYEEYLASLRDEDFKRKTKQQVDVLNFDPSGKSSEQAQKALNDAKNELDVLQKRENKLRIAIGLYEQIESKKVFEAGYPGINSDTEIGRKVLAEREILASLRERFAALGIEYRANEKDAEAMREALRGLGGDAAATASEIEVLEDQLKRVREAEKITEEQKSLQDSALASVEAQLEVASSVVKSREDELQAIQKAVEASQRALEIEERRYDAIRKAASARDDEFAKQKLGLQNTILDMEANEKIKGVKDEAQSKEENIREQARRARQWAEQQAKVDKFNANQQAKLFGKNPQNLFNIDEQKAKWLQGLDEWEKRQLDMIKKTEQSGIESAKKTAEIAKQANLDAMEAVQKKKVENLKAESEQLLGQGRFGDAQDALDKAQKTLKEIADAKVGNLNQKDSVQQGKDALREWEELQKQIKAVDDQKLAVSAKAQEAEKQRMLQQKALEDQAEARLEAAKASHEQLLNIKELIKNTPMIDPSELDAVAKFRAEMERILAMKLQMGSIPALNGAGTPIQGPMPLPGTSGTGSGGSTMPGMPTAPGTQFNMSFSMNNATPNSVAAAANSIVQSQKAMAMLSGV